MSDVQAAGKIQSNGPVLSNKKDASLQKAEKKGPDRNYIVAEREKMSIADAALALVLWPFSIQGCTSSGKIKETHELTESETGGLEQLLIGIYKEQLKLRPYGTFYSTDSQINPKTEQKLDNPIHTISAVTNYVSIEHQDPEVKRRLADAILSKAISWEENGRMRSLRISEAFIEVDSSSGIGYQSMPGSFSGIQYEVVTIYPLKVQVDYK